MIGHNELLLNEATLIEAMQEYLDKRMPGVAPKVVNVKMESGRSYSGDLFKVTVNDKEPTNGK